MARYLPLCFGNWHTIYTLFKRWRDNGLFWNIIKESHNNKMATFDMVWLDSTAIKLHRHGAGAPKKGKAISKGGIEPLCLSPGNHAGSTYCQYLHDNIKNIRYIMADKGHDSDAMRICV